MLSGTSLHRMQPVPSTKLQISTIKRCPVPTRGRQHRAHNPAAQQQHQQQQNRPLAKLHSSPQGMYEQALELSRQERYDQAREAFEALLHSHPTFCKAWVSYAQMEKRMGRLSDPLRMGVARQILQRGLSINPDSGCLAQAWGLMELQRGNMWAAVRLLERCVDMDPFLTPVLRWKPVTAARMTVAGSSSRRSSQQHRRTRGVACASQATVAAGVGSAVAASGTAAAGATPGCAGSSAGSCGVVPSGAGSPAGGSSSAGGAGPGSSTGGCMSSM